MAEPADETKQLKDFLVKDYELNVRYLSDHFTRMWTRFTFLLTLDSALFGFSMNQNYPPGYAWLFVGAGVLLSLIWLAFGSADNSLVEIYRGQVKQTFGQLKIALEDPLDYRDEKDEEKHYYHTGERPTWYKARKEGLVTEPEGSGKLRKIMHSPILRFGDTELSTTELSVILPGAFVLLWVLRAIYELAP